MKVYAFLYCSCVHESAAKTVSVHRSKAGAYRAMRAHRVAMCVAHREVNIKYGKNTWGFRYDTHHWWGMSEMDVLD